MSHRLLLATILFTSILLPAWAKADIVGIERIVDTETRVPNDLYNFNPGFDAAAVGGDVYFIGGRRSPSNEYYSGLFRSRGGVIEKLVDSTDVIPGSTGGEKFDVFERVWVNDGRIVFTARDQGFQQSLYELGSGDTVISLADNGATSTSHVGQAIPLADGSLRFQSVRTDISPPGFYDLDNGVRAPLANNTTALPDGSGNFLDSSFSLIATLSSDFDKDGTVVFRGEGNGGQIGMYSDRGGSLEKVFDLNDTMPGTSSDLIDLGAKINDGIIGVLMVASPTEMGVYKIDEANQLTSLVDTLTVHPDTGTNFKRLGSFDFDKDIFLFEGRLAFDGPSSLFYDDGSGIKKFLGPGDQVDGRSIISVSNPQSIGNGEFLFSARSDGAQDSLYRVQFAPTAVPEPSAVVILFFGTVLCATSRRRSRTGRASENTCA